MARKAKCNFSEEKDQMCDLMSLVEGVWTCTFVKMETEFFCECPAFCRIDNKICDSLRYGENTKEQMCATIKDNLFYINELEKCPR